MNENPLAGFSYLDEIRIKQGPDQCRNTLTSILQKDTRRAVALLNDRRLTFPCLYILSEPILRRGIQRNLSIRPSTALRILGRIRESKAAGTHYLTSKGNSVYPVLKWILETGSAEDIPEDHYAHMLDVTSSVLLNVYKDTAILPLVVELTFKRNRQDSYIHDLVWVLFRFHDPNILKLIAGYLQSSNQRDIKLAAELLNLDEVELSTTTGEAMYQKYLRWLEENQPYLYFTEETLQYTSKPVFCTVDLERKYLQKAASAHKKQPISSLEEDEAVCIEGFKQLSAQEQKILSGYSHNIHSKSVPTWKEWLHTPVKEQIKAAKAGWEAEK
ncbi:hypothetical protein U6B65_13670 [Oscillospiraceae bacterium MB08-C2-2]|nr:hypothetical protein U6B65_13670 [Oscillospiraceae bacterium MB08-C2-2]